MTGGFLNIHLSDVVDNKHQVNGAYSHLGHYQSGINQFAHGRRVGLHPEWARFKGALG